MRFAEVDRQPMPMRYRHGNGTASHYYDENVLARETFTAADGTVATIRAHVGKGVKRPTSWSMAVIVTDAADTMDYWAGGITKFNGRFNVYVRRDGHPNVDIKNLASDQEALEWLRWALARVYR